MRQILHVIDVEGTRSSGIVEYGIVALADFEIFDVKTVLCKGSFEEHINCFINLRKIGSFVGHNACVEDRLLRHYAASPGLVRDFSGFGDMVNTWGPWIDTKILYKNFFRGVSDFSLGNLIGNFGLSDELFFLSERFCGESKVGYHNALFDALATYLLLKHLVDELNKADISVSTGTLIEYSKKTGLC